MLHFVESKIHVTLLNVEKVGSVAFWQEPNSDHGTVAATILARRVVDSNQVASSHAGKMQVWSGHRQSNRAEKL